jgi:hypothetical protein
MAASHWHRPKLQEETAGRFAALRPTDSNSTQPNHPNVMKNIVKFILETLACMAIGMIFAILFYNAL